MIGGIVAVAVGVWLIRWHLRRTAARPGGHFCARYSVILGGEPEVLRAVRGRRPYRLG
ncbi:MAG: hypothetical protein K6U89_09445 [Chloroflexi bacterium]|nr:hypothetical protein [Chloroflexota bacterium]